ncbi:ATP-binding protein [Nonomuraea pusilla]|uniref:Anti-sigma regulatory factor (Ser/Thr protein kinase) n=1 Tax=Nonomuraea pusilla TaxID=46177 RepID=A0A1H7LRQ4_9ACTN|nr:ATP-binding protein [Nonomuraea pusilla]SEL01652.1 Anti-sigma regulatory factor (Ser/Thr protein kinase) [Nonomuraea pusilla]
MGEESELRCPITWDLGLLRERVSAFAADAGFSGPRLQDLVLAVNEAADNVLEHGGGAGAVVLGADGQGIRVDVLDRAGTLTSAHLYRHASAPPPAARGYGLWIIRQLCDEVAVDHPDGVSRLRMYFQAKPGSQVRDTADDQADAGS